MTERVLDLREFNLIDHPEQNEKLQKWLRFNGINPHRVVENSLLSVRDGYAEIVFFGQDRTYRNGFVAKTVETVFIHTDLEEFGL